MRAAQKDKWWKVASCGSVLIKLNPVSPPSLPPSFPLIISFFLLSLCFVLNIFCAPKLLLLGPCLARKGIFTVWELLFAGQVLYFHTNYNRSRNLKFLCPPSGSCVVNSHFFCLHTLCLCRLPIDSNLVDRYNNKHMYQVLSTRAKDQVWVFRCTAAAAVTESTVWMRFKYIPRQECLSLLWSVSQPRRHSEASCAIKCIRVTTGTCFFSALFFHLTRRNFSRQLGTRFRGNPGYVSRLIYRGLPDLRLPTSRDGLEASQDYNCLVDNWDQFLWGK